MVIGAFSEARPACRGCGRQEALVEFDDAAEQLAFGSHHGAAQLVQRHDRGAVPVGDNLCMERPSRSADEDDRPQPRNSIGLRGSYHAVMAATMQRANRKDLTEPQDLARTSVVLEIPLHR